MYIFILFRFNMKLKHPALKENLAVTNIYTNKLTNQSVAANLKAFPP